MLEQSASGFTFCREGEILSLEPYGENIVRVRATAGGRLSENRWTLLEPRESRWDAGFDRSDAVLRNGKITARLTADGGLSFANQEGRVLLREQWSREADRAARNYLAHSSELFGIEVRFEPNPGERLYGMGQEAHDLFNLKGAVIDLCQQNSKCTIPFLFSSSGYGFLWNNPGIGRAELGASCTRWVAEASRQIDYLVIAGDNPAEIVRRYASLTGFAPEFPEWAAGLWQSRLRYETQEELLSVAREYHRRNIPISMIVCDYFHWPQQGDWKFDSACWPDPGAMVKELEAMDTRLLVSIWPTVDPRSENYPVMKERNMLVRTERGPGTLVYCRGPETYYDATNPEAGEFVFDRVRKNYQAYGIRNFWLDESEPEIGPYHYDNLRYHLGNGLEVSNLYPYYYAKNFYDGLTKSGQEEVLNLIRCAFIGSQRFGVVLWSGDILTDFDSLRRQIKAGLHVSLCGIPWWTTDIGGFHGGDPDDPAYRECIIRWFQFGAFCPVFRMHGFRHRDDRPAVSPHSLEGFCPGGGPNEIWSYGEEALQIMTRFILLRERLRPYIMQQMHRASTDGTPVMRPLFFDYPEEPCFDIFDQYMFGPSIMVCPVHQVDIWIRPVYLPSGAVWVDAASGEEYTGGKWIDAPAPLDRIPVYFVKGSEPLSVPLVF